MRCYSGIVQSVEQRTVKLGVTREKVLRKTAETCGFFNICSLHIGINFWKKVRVLYAIYCPFFCKSYTLVYATPRHTVLHIEFLSFLFNRMMNNILIQFVNNILGGFN